MRPRGGNGNEFKATVFDPAEFQGGTLLMGGQDKEEKRKVKIPRREDEGNHAEVLLL